MREKTNRSSRRNSNSKIEPKRKLFLGCEGENTEPEYFGLLVQNQIACKLSPLVEIILLEKPGAEKGISNPKRLLELLQEELSCSVDRKVTVDYLLRRIANEFEPGDKEYAKKVYQELLCIFSDNCKNMNINSVISVDSIDEFVQNLLDLSHGSSDDVKTAILNFTLEPLNYSPDIDSIYLIVDRDQQSFKEDQYVQVLESCKQDRILFCPSNPSFELWLLLHFRSIESDELPLFLANRHSKKKKGEKRRRYTEIELRKYLSGYSKIKGCLSSSGIINRLEDAVAHAATLPSSPEELLNKVGTSIPLLIQDIMWKPDESESNPANKSEPAPIES